MSGSHRSPFVVNLSNHDCRALSSFDKLRTNGRGGIAPERKGGSVRFAGYAALFGVADGVGDTIRPGAFAKALSDGTTYPLYWQHNPAQPIGRVEAIAEDERGLRVIARLDSHDSRAADLLLRGQVSGLSFGYRARGFERVPDGRVLRDIELLEVSLVTHPLQPGARVHLVE